MSALALTIAFDGHRVRMVGTPEQPEWIAKDVCGALEIHNSRRALREIVPPDEKGVRVAYTPGGPQELATVTEGGLYRLISRSRKPSAERFQAWIFNEVLPTLRKYGCYPAPATPAVDALAGLNLRDLNQLARVALQLTEIVQEKDARIAELEPKAEAHDRLQAADGEVSVRACAKAILVAERRLIFHLLADRIAFRNAQGRLEAYAKYVTEGYLRNRPVVVGREQDGSDRVVMQMVIRAPGIHWLASRYAGLLSGGPRLLSH